jgi:hypothetical protein
VPLYSASICAIFQTSRVRSIRRFWRLSMVSAVQSSNEASLALILVMELFFSSLGQPAILLVR